MLYDVRTTFRSSDDRPCFRSGLTEASTPRRALAKVLRLMPDFARRRLTAVWVYPHVMDERGRWNVADTPVIVVMRRPEPFVAALRKRRPVSLRTLQRWTSTRRRVRFCD